MYKRIICPVDGSLTSNRGMQEAISLAKNQHAKLRFLHIIDTYLPIIDGVGNYIPVDISDVLHENAEKVLKEATAVAKKAGIVTEAEIVETVGVRPSELIVKQSKDWAADVIVMGTHGLRGFNRMVMGSDAENVVRTSVVPVLLVNKSSAKVDG